MKEKGLFTISPIPPSAAGVSLVFVLMIMSGIGWGGAQSHMRHADKATRSGKKFQTVLVCFNSASK